MPTRAPDVCARPSGLYSRRARSAATHAPLVNHRVDQPQNGSPMTERQSDKGQQRHDGEPAGRCARCGYPMNPGWCPECGAELLLRDLHLFAVRTRDQRRWWRRLLVVVILCALFNAVLWFGCLPSRRGGYPTLSSRVTLSKYWVWSLLGPLPFAVSDRDLDSAVFAAIMCAALGACAVASYRAPQSAPWACGLYLSTLLWFLIGAALAGFA